MLVRPKQRPSALNLVVAAIPLPPLTAVCFRIAPGNARKHPSDEVQMICRTVCARSSRRNRVDIGYRVILLVNAAGSLPWSPVLIIEKKREPGHCVTKKKDDTNVL